MDYVCTTEEELRDLNNNMSNEDAYQREVSARMTAPERVTLSEILDRSEEEEEYLKSHSEYLNEEEMAENLAIKRQFYHDPALSSPAIQRQIRLVCPLVDEENGFVPELFKTYDDPSGDKGPLLFGRSLNEQIQLIDKNLRERRSAGVQKFEMKVEMNVDSFRFMHGSVLAHAELLDGYGGKVNNLRDRQSRLSRERISLRLGVNGLFPTVSGRKVKNVPLDNFPSSLLLSCVQVKNMTLGISVVFMHRKYLNTNYLTNTERAVLNICLNVSKLHYKDFIGDELLSGDVITLSDFQKYVQVLSPFVEKTRENTTKFDMNPLPPDCFKMFLICFERVFKHFAELNVEGGCLGNKMMDIEFEKSLYHGFCDKVYESDVNLDRDVLIGKSIEMFNNRLYVSLIKNVKQAHTQDEDVLRKKKFIVEHPFPPSEGGLSYVNRRGETVIAYKHLRAYIEELYAVVIGDFLCNFDFCFAQEGKGIMDVGLDFWSLKEGEYLVCSMEDLRYDMKQNYSQLFRLQDDYLSVMDKGSQMLILEKYHLENDVDRDFIQENVNQFLDKIDESCIPSSLLSLLAEGKREKFSKFGMFGSTMYGGGTTGRISCLLYRTGADDNIVTGLPEGDSDSVNEQYLPGERLQKPLSVKPLWDGDMMGIVAYSNKLKTAQMKSSVVDLGIYDRVLLFVWKLLEGFEIDERKVRPKMECLVRKHLRKVDQGLNNFLVETRNENVDLRLETFQNTETVQNFVSAKMSECMSDGGYPTREERKEWKAGIKSGCDGLLSGFTNLKFGEIIHIGHMRDLQEIDVLVSRSMRVLKRIFLSDFDLSSLPKLSIGVRLSILAHVEYGMLLLGLVELRQTRIWKRLAKKVPFGHVLNYPLDCLQKLSTRMNEVTGLEFGLSPLVYPLKTELTKTPLGFIFYFDERHYVGWNYMEEDGRDFSSEIPGLTWREYHECLLQGKAKFSDLRSNFLGKIDCVYSCSEVLGTVLSLFHYYDVYGVYHFMWNGAPSSLENFSDLEVTQYHRLEEKNDNLDHALYFDKFMRASDDEILASLFLPPQMDVSDKHLGWGSLDDHDSCQLLRKVWKVIFLLYAEYMYFKKIYNQKKEYALKLNISNFPMSNKELSDLLGSEEGAGLLDDFCQSASNQGKRRKVHESVVSLGKFVSLIVMFCLALCVFIVLNVVFVLLFVYVVR